MLNEVTRKILNTNKLSIHFLLWSMLLAIFINLISNLLSYKVGNFQGILIIVFLILCLIILLIVFEKKNEKKLRKLMYSSIDSMKLQGEYKGLIAFVSDNREKGEKEKREYLEKCKREIRNYKETGNIEIVTNLRGIGQTFRALDYHLKTGKLRHCWLIYSDQSCVNMDVVESFFETVTGNTIEPEAVKIKDPNSIKHIKKIIDKIYSDFSSDLKETDIIADITARNKPMTTAMVLSCLNSDRGLEYIEQSEKTSYLR
jgi:hypothetical protein